MRPNSLSKDSCPRRERPNRAVTPGAHKCLSYRRQRKPLWFMLQGRSERILQNFLRFGRIALTCRIVDGRQETGAILKLGYFQTLFAKQLHHALFANQVPGAHNH